MLGLSSVSRGSLTRVLVDSAGEGLRGEGGGTGFSTRDTSWAAAPRAGSRYFVSTDTFMS